MSQRKHYFGAGPAALPQGVLEEMAKATLDYNGNGVSLLSIPHRGPAFKAILEEANAMVLHLAGLSADEYAVLWLQGGGRQQFAMLPMNFLGEEETAGYLDSGHWAKAAMQSAEYYGRAIALASSEASAYTKLPAWPQEFPGGLKYIHLTANNTIYGTQWPLLPASEVPLIADMSSDIFSVKRDFSRCALFYAVAQKQLGPAGVTLVVGRRSLLESGVRRLPDVFSYAAQMRAGSVLNTPPVAAIYCCLLTLRWMAHRGLEHIEADNHAKAAMVYEAIDEGSIFYGVAEKESRSLTNVVFRARREEDEAAFLKYASAKSIEGIKGHRSVGGFRASLYNAVSLKDADALASAIRNFETQKR
jgi:phosphoserine aminotransferase